MSTRSYQKATIAVNGTVSTVAQSNGQQLAGVYVPANFTGSSLTFIGNNVSGSLSGPVSNGASALSVTVAAGQYVPLTPGTFQGLDAVQFVANTNQLTAAAVLTAVFGPQ